MKILRAVLGVIPITASAQGIPDIPWAPHDSARPLPPVVRPPPPPVPQPPPSDALVLFDGSGLSAWRAVRDDAAAGWLIVRDVVEVAPGVLVQDRVPLTGPTGHRQRPPYEVHPDRLPLRLQDHGQPVRFRNVWIRDLEGP